MKQRIVNSQLKRAIKTLHTNMRGSIKFTTIVSYKDNKALRVAKQVSTGEIKQLKKHLCKTFRARKSNMHENTTKSTTI